MKQAFELIGARLRDAFSEFGQLLRKAFNIG
jgi:hypothetical protein